MGRVYDVTFKNVTIAAAQDLVACKGSTGKTCKVRRIWLYMNDSTLQTAQGLRLNLKYGSATVTLGSGGSSPTPRPHDPGDAAASFSCHANDTTGVPPSPATHTSVIPFTSIVRQADRSWLFSWDSTGAEYYRVVLNGTQLKKVTVTSFSFSRADYEDYPPPLEAVEEITLTPTEQYKPFLTLQWYTKPCDLFTVYEIVGLDSFLVGRFNNNGRVWVYSYQTPILEDGSLHSYELTATGNGEQESDPRKFKVTPIVCPPTFVDGTVEITYDKPTLSVVISEVV